MNWCQSFLERNVFERKKKLSIKKSCLQDEACLRIKPESPKAYYDTLIHMFKCSQKSSDNLPAPNLHPAARHWAVLFFTHRLVSGHVYEVNIASWSPFLSIRKSKYQRDIILPRRWSSYVIWFVLHIWVEAWVAQVISYGGIDEGNSNTSCI